MRKFDHSPTFGGIFMTTVYGEEPSSPSVLLGEAAKIRMQGNPGS